MGTGHRAAGGQRGGSPQSTRCTTGSSPPSSPRCCWACCCTSGPSSTRSATADPGRAEGVRRADRRRCGIGLATSCSPSIVSAVLLGVLLYFRAEFYAVGDPRTRWRALWVFVGLIVADVAIGLTYILLAKGLAQSYSLWQMVVHTVYGLVGVSGPVRFVPERRADLFTLLTGDPRAVHPGGHGVPLLPAGPRRRAARAAGRAAGPGPAGQARGPGLAGLLHAAQRQEPHLVPDRQVLHRLPGRVRGHAGRR